MINNTAISIRTWQAGCLEVPAFKHLHAVRLRTPGSRTIVNGMVIDKCSCGAIRKTPLTEATKGKKIRGNWIEPPQAPVKIVYRKGATGAQDEYK